MHQAPEGQLSLIDQLGKMAHLPNLNFVRLFILALEAETRQTDKHTNDTH